MKNLILIAAFLTLPVVAFSQVETTKSAVAKELISIKKTPEAAPKKTRAARSAKFLKVNYKKSNDIISTKAYRKSLKDKLRREKLC